MIENLFVEIKDISNPSVSSLSSSLKSSLRKKMKIKSGLIIYKKSEKTQNIASTADVLPFLKIIPVGTEFEIKNCRETIQTSETLLDDLWLEITEASAHKNKNIYPILEIKTNDIIRLGEASIKVLSLNYEDSFVSPFRKNSFYSSRAHSITRGLLSNGHYSNSKEFENFTQLDEQIAIKNWEKEENDGPICRICYTEVSENDKNNLGITVCQCSGSMQYSHLSCLKKWLNKKIKPLVSNEIITIFETSELFCEICLNEIPDKILINGIEHRLIEFDDKYKNYIVIKDNYNGLISVLNLSHQNEFYIGKGLDCDVFVSHDSVDDTHCKLIVFNGKVFIEDCNSKNKTFLKINDEFVLNPFVDKYNFIKGNYSVVIKPEREKIDFPSIFCGIFCGKKNVENKQCTKEIFLE